MPSCFQALTAQRCFDYSIKSYHSVLSHFYSLAVVESMYEQTKGLGTIKPPAKNLAQLRMAKKTIKAKLTCGYCKKPSYVKDMFWKKKKAEKAKTKANQAKTLAIWNIKMVDVNQFDFHGI